MVIAEPLDSLRRGGFIPKRWWGTLLLGAGGFQLYDAPSSTRSCDRIISATT